MQVSGEEFELSSTNVESTRLDQETVKALLTSLEATGKITKEQHQECYSSSTSLTVRTARKDPAKKIKFEAPKLGPNITPEAIADMMGVAGEMEAKYKKEKGYLREALLARLTPQPDEVYSAPAGNEAGFHLDTNSETGGE